MTESHAGRTERDTRSKGPASRLEEAIERAGAEGRVGLMAHIVAGYPTLDDSARAMECMVDAGVDAIEVQVPFSDPTADGPKITAASKAALDGGVRVGDVFDLAASVAASHEVPILLMAYFNLVFAHGGGPEKGGGVQRFVARAASAGASGLIVPDIPADDRREGYAEACRESGVHPIYVISPNCPDRRLRTVAEVASGMIYVTSRTGTTGREMELHLGDLSDFLGRVRKVLPVPRAVGFSISRRDQVEALRGHAEVAVVGTHLLRAFEGGGLEALRRELRALLGR